MASGQQIARYLNDPSQKPQLYIDVSPQPASFSGYPNRSSFASPKSASSASSSRRSSATEGTEMYSPSTAASSVSSPTNDPALFYDQTEPQYWLQCTFHEIGCKVQFYPHDRESWRSHCLSHWRNQSPPKDCICIFCDEQFRGSSAWNNRILHIEGHLAGGAQVERDSRPDFALYRHMYKKGLIGETVYRSMTTYSESAGAKDLGLQPMDYKPAKLAYRDDVVTWDQRKEDKERKSHRSKGKGRESKHRH